MEIEKLKKSSRQGAIKSIFGFLIIIAVIVFAGFRLNALNEEISQKQAQVNDLTELQDELLEEINRLKDPTIQPHARAKEVPGIFDSQDRQIFDFTVWITSSQHTINQIDKVV